MKNILLICLSLLMVTACGDGKSKKQTTDTKAADENTVYVYYFHAKQRCVTCNTVEEVTKKTIEENYASNPNVKFVLLANYEKENEALVEKYEISWNGLVIAKGNDHVDITEQAFANAVNNPEVLTELIKTEVNKRLQ